MPKHQVHYTDDEAGERRAIEDVRDYLDNQEAFEILKSATFRDFDQFRFSCWIVGIQGFPVYAMWRTFHES